MEEQIRKLISNVDIINFDTASELCSILRRLNGYNETVRKEVVAAVEQIKEEFKQNLDKWAASFDHEEARRLSAKLMDVAIMLTERFDEIARREFCASLKTVAIMFDTLREMHRVAK